MRGWDRRSVTNTRVIAFSLPNCKSEFTSPLCLIVDLTCRMRGALGLPARNNSTNKHQTPGLLDVELQTLLPSSIQIALIRKALYLLPEMKGAGQPSHAAGGDGNRHKVPFPSWDPRRSFSVGEVGAGALHAGLRYLAFIAFLLKVL